MNQRLHEPAKKLAQSLTRRQALNTFGVGLAGMALTCFALMESALGQTSVVCDAAGDAHYSGGKGGPVVPAWLDIIRGEITADSSDDLLFTLTLNAPIPGIPAWNVVDDGGQIWWGWGLVGDLASDTAVAGCIKSNGQLTPAGYFLHIIWDVQSSSFHARLLDDTSCTESAVNSFFSTDRTQVTLVAPKAMLTNKTLIPDPDHFQFFAVTVVWKPSSIGNTSEFHIDHAPDPVNGQLVVGTWSASSNNSYFCP